MSIQRQALADYLAELLHVRSFKDYGYNGIQVSGGEEIQRIASSTTASLEVCRKAASSGVDALFVHHGLIWGGVDRIDGMLRDRLAHLLGANCNLFAYHLPLDADPERGNNRKALDALQIQVRGSFGEYKGQEIGLWGELESPVSAAELAQRCASCFSHPVIHCPGSSALIRKIGIVTGGGQSCLLDAHAAGLDALITGEASEQTWHEAAETGCHCFACGHYATENIAIHDLAAHLAEKFQLEHVRLVQDNPI